jgi:DNA-binding IclR family transcriptional regulator
VLWLVPLLCAAVGTIVLAWCAQRALREIDPTRDAINGFGSRLRPALLRVRDETARTRRRVDGDR